MPDQGFVFPWNSSGNLTGMMMVACNSLLAVSRPATWSHLTLGFSLTMALAKESFSLSFSLSFFLPDFPSSPEATGSGSFSREGNKRRNGKAYFYLNISWSPRICSCIHQSCPSWYCECICSFRLKIAMNEFRFRVIYKADTDRWSACPSCT